MPTHESERHLSRSPFLEFGGHESSAILDVPGTLEYLRSMGLGDGDLAQARQALADRRHETVVFESFGSSYCDFCFTELMGGEYEQLRDGRERCTRCSRSVISDEDAFRDEFERVRSNMEIAFGISIPTRVIVRMVNAHEIARHTGERFTPTAGVDPRVVGFVDRGGPVPLLCIENGAPRMCAVTTMAHELTHIWQDANWNVPEVERRVGRQNLLATREGMAVWAEIQYLLQVREYSYAMRQLAYALGRTDEYGVGFRVFAEVYPLSEDPSPSADSPFKKPIPL